MSIKTFLILFFALFLTACSEQEEVLSWEERVAAAEEKSSAQENTDEESFVSSNEAQVLDLKLKDENQIFDQYLPTLMFHYIENVPSDSPDQMRYGLSFPPESLEEFLIYFKENNIQTLTYHDLIPIINGEKAFPEKAVMLTFDDGHNDHYSEAFRLLEEYDMKGVFFIIAGKPDIDPEYATWEQVKEMSDAGQEIASHTFTHPSLPTLSAETLKAELQDSKKVLEEKIGRPVISIAYPGGDYDQATLDVTKEIYTFARTTEPGRDFSLQNRYELPTVRIFPETGVASLRTWFENN